MARRQVRVHVLQAPEHPERGTQRSAGVVLVGDGHAERGHDRVADELLDGPALGLDLLAHRREVGVQDLADRSGSSCSPSVVDPSGPRRAP